MSKRKFSSAERLAVFTVHGSKCYICREPLSYTSMEIDHIVPEQLLADPVRLATVLASLGRPTSFDVNSFENWLPSCKPCNGLKSGTPFDPAPIVLIHLQLARTKANEARRLAARTIADQELGKAIAVVEVAATANDLPFQKIRPLVELFLSQHHDVIKAMADEKAATTGTISWLGLGLQIQRAPLLELRLTPFATVVYWTDRYELIQTPIGTGYRPTDPVPDASFYCGHCGSLGPWSGARCLNCGYLSEND
jgi:5-methylcytosine-specific restriction endonuclease McrA